jgi:hypothetical protein
MVYKCCVELLGNKVTSCYITSQDLNSKKDVDILEITEVKCLEIQTWMNESKQVYYDRVTNTFTKGE